MIYLKMFRTSVFTECVLSCLKKWNSKRETLFLMMERALKNTTESLLSKKTLKEQATLLIDFKTNLNNLISPNSKLEGSTLS